jgi:hypothetical protein
MALLVRRYKRLVPLAILVFIISVLVINTHRRHNERITGRKLLARDLKNHRTGVVQRIREVSQAPLSLQVDEVGYEELDEEGDDSFERIYDEYQETSEYDTDDTPSEAQVRNESEDSNSQIDEPDNNNNDIIDDNYEPLPETEDCREIFSLTTSDRKFFTIYLGGDTAYNPSLIPHPTQHDLWIVIAQHEQSDKEGSLSEELLVCTAGFFNGVLLCTGTPTVLPVTQSIQGSCEGDLAYYNFRTGPRDARMFYGPEAPYIAYGSQSTYTCLSIWLQDVRMLLQDFRLEQMTLVKLFKRASEVQRPPPVKGVEKNFFVFWDSENKAYVHHDIYPHRVFAQLSFDGSVGPDLAPAIASKDGICMAKYMPTVVSTHESIHQATNSLSVTLCRRTDPICVPSDANTFLMTIFHHKSYYDWHSVYEPYVMLFQRSAPFAIYAISQRPLWIHGRGPLNKDTHAVHYENNPDRALPEGHSEMFYITSMSWRSHDQRYHGYIDDPMFLAFGIEDSRPAAMDVLAGDLLQDLGFCAH